MNWLDIEIMALQDDFDRFINWVFKPRPRMGMASIIITVLIMCLYLLAFFTRS